MSLLRSLWKSFAVRTVAGVASVVALGSLPAAADPVITGLHYTGENIPVGQGGQDDNWMVEAWPVDAPITPSTPYKAYVFSGTGPGDENVPPPWFPGAPTGHTNPGYAGGRWIGLRDNNAHSVLPDGFGAIVGTYNTVYSTRFTASEAGTAHLWFLAAADNAVTFYVNGSITGANTNYPTIAGGSMLGYRIQGLSTLHGVVGDVPVNAGFNTLYAVVEDKFGSTNTYGYTGLIVVPEPSTYAYAGLALLSFGAVGLKRRVRKHAA